MKLERELINFRRFLVAGIVIMSIATYFHPYMAVLAWACFLIVILTYLFDVTYYKIGKVELLVKIRTILWLFSKGLVGRHAKIADVKAYYTNEQYDWITDVKFPEEILHTRRRKAMSEKAQTYITCSDVLDLGCGTGLITQVLPGNVTGIDISPWKIERAQQHCPLGTFLVGDIEDLSVLLPDNSFDAVVCTDVLEHLEAPNKVVNGTWRVLRNDGIFIGTVPSKHIIWRFRRFLTTANSLGEPFHIHYNIKQLRQLLYPFEIIEISTQCLGLELFFAVRKK